MFEELPEAFACLCKAARSFAPDAIISHAYEGAHLDHDACSFLTTHTAAELALPYFEFPLYWLDVGGIVVRQSFRDSATPGSTANNVMELQLTESEIDRKRKMLSEYHTQRATVSSFAVDVERFRLASASSNRFRDPICRDYMYQERRPRFYHTRHHRLSAKYLLKEFSDFEASLRETADQA